MSSIPIDLGDVKISETKEQNQISETAQHVNETEIPVGVYEAAQKRAIQAKILKPGSVVYTFRNRNFLITNFEKPETAAEAIMNIRAQLKLDEDNAEIQRQIEYSKYLDDYVKFLDEQETSKTFKETPDAIKQKYKPEFEPYKRGMIDQFKQKFQKRKAKRIEAEREPKRKAAERKAEAERKEAEREAERTRRKTMQPQPLHHHQQRMRTVQPFYPQPQLPAKKSTDKPTEKSTTAADTANGTNNVLYVLQSIAGLFSGLSV